MPTYEYLCPTCGVVEALQSMRDAPLTSCPRCGLEAVTRLVSRGAGVIFKGSGFWETDYNRPPAPPSEAPPAPREAPKPAPGGATPPA